MPRAKKGPATAELPKLTSIYLRLQQIEKDRRKAEDIERMIEAKVSQALRQMTY
jgi:hypothetical protein